MDATKLLRLAADRRLAALSRVDPVAAQRRTLGQLVRRAAGTQFGRDHGFAEVRTVRDYQAQIGLRRYEDFARAYWQPGFPRLRDVTWPGLIPAFAQSSGTTGGPTKRIPVSRAMLRSNRGAAFDVLAFHLAARPASRVFGGRNLLLGGSTAFEHLSPGVRAGDLSGIAADRVPAWARTRAFPSRSIALLDDWEAKVAAIGAASLEADIRSISGTPSWMLLYFEHLATLLPERPRRLAEIYPHLELVVHGGVAFEPYRAQFARWLEGGFAETREVYAASEGFIAAADRGPGEGLRLVLDRGLFFEFVRPEQVDGPAPDRRWLATAETGVDYALVLSTNAGLWSYVIGDTVRLVDLHPPRIVVTGRLGMWLNAFGEHLIVEELDGAIAEAARLSAVTVSDYTVHAVLDGARGRHRFVVESAGSARFARHLDTALQRRNADYASHRAGDFGIDAPEVVFVPPGTFAGWMRRRGKLGGQNKVPRVLVDAAALQDLVSPGSRVT